MQERTMRLDRILRLGTPLAFAILTLFHPMPDPQDLGDSTTLWMTVHLLQLVFTVLLGYSIWSLLAGLAGRGAGLARACLPVMVAFSSFDSVAGLATGWLAQTAKSQTGEEQAATLRAVESLFGDNWLAGNLSVMGAVTAFAWLGVVAGTFAALKKAGADRLTLVAMGFAAFFVSHAPPLGTVGLLALFAAMCRWEKSRSRHQKVRGTGTSARTDARK